jgi:hypothetical protein
MNPIITQSNNILRPAIMAMRLFGPSPETMANFYNARNARRRARDFRAAECERPAWHIVSTDPTFYDYTHAERVRAVKIMTGTSN